MEAQAPNVLEAMYSVALGHGQWRRTTAEQIELHVFVQPSDGGLRKHGGREEGWGLFSDAGREEERGRGLGGSGLAGAQANAIACIMVCPPLSVGSMASHTPRVCMKIFIFIAYAEQLFFESIGYWSDTEHSMIFDASMISMSEGIYLGMRHSKL